MFNKQWFEQHKGKLLRLLNFPLIGWLMRRFLYIKTNNKITDIYPSSFEYEETDGSYTATFYTDNHFSKMLYESFKPLWIIAHMWDIVVANPLCPQYNLGFDHTFSPDPVGGQVTSCMGTTYVNNVNMDWGDIIVSEAAGMSYEELNSGSIASYSVSYKFSFLSRGMMIFDTSSLPDTIKIRTSKITLTGCIECPNDNDFYYMERNNISFSIYGLNSDSTSTLKLSDHLNCGTVPLSECVDNIRLPRSKSGSLVYQPFDFNLNDDGVLNINKKGVSRFSIRTVQDVKNIAPLNSWQNSRYAYYSIRVTTEQKPVLVVNFCKHKPRSYATVSNSLGNYSSGELDVVFKGGDLSTTGALNTSTHKNTALIKFDLAEYATKPINKATLNLYVTACSTGTVNIASLEIYPVKALYNPDAVTWYNRDTGTPWNVEGCKGVGVDIENTASAIGVQSDYGPLTHSYNDYMSVDILPFLRSFGFDYTVYRVGIIGQSVSSAFLHGYDSNHPPYVEFEYEDSNDFHSPLPSRSLKDSGMFYTKNTGIVLGRDYNQYSIEGNNSFYSPERAEFDFGLFTAFTAGTEPYFSQTLVISNYNFEDVPKDAIILGIELIIKARGSVGGYCLRNPRLFLNGSSIALKSTGVIMDNIFTEYIFGSSSDTWGLSLTPEDLKNRTFGGGCHVDGDTYISYIGMRVTYKYPV